MKLYSVSYRVDCINIKTYVTVRKIITTLVHIDYEVKVLQPCIYESA
jgi:hypothetical protein